ncbi:MAG: flavodoxin family protein [Gammaproteobacteria bacterium]|nr:flavodoxin family protein [Gammaproteobacteria bacterium]NNL49472.1 flavodoxin family protein [Woeseiaceae bacterium]
MNANTRILAINGSYRSGGVTDQTVAGLLENLQTMGADVEQIKLREYPIEFCLNCRECMQQPGDAPGRCVHNDGMAKLVQKIEDADGYVFAAPTNFSSVTALFKRFSERLAVYGYWPWGKPAPKFRRANSVKKPVILISSCAAPGLLGRFTYATNKSLKVAAKTIGGKVVGSMVTGLISQEREPGLPRRTRRRLRALAPKLIT